jgi:hypothetical protein
MTKSRNLITPKHRWTDAQIAQLRELYPHHKTAQVAVMMGLREGPIYQRAAGLGLKKSPEYLASPDACRLRRGDNVGAAYRFKPGLTVWNKGMKDLHIGGEETLFKPGSTPPNRLPVGHIRTNSEGYQDIKSAPGLRKWVPLHHWNWKQAHGSYPAKGMALVFKDENRQNCAIENLELLTRAELMRRNTVHNLPPELAKAVQLIGALNRKINHGK